MRAALGIISPIVTATPGRHGRWERTAGIRELAEIARTADALGYHHLTCSEHVAIPRDVAAQRGSTYWDPLATLGYLSAVTSRIRLVTQVLVLGYHHPLEIIKRYGTLDVVSGGRLILGVGVGSLTEEFDLLDAPFSDRGTRADEALRAIRDGFGSRTQDFSGEFYSYRDFITAPAGIQSPPPIWVGGRTARSLRRAIEFGEGWVPFGLDAPSLRALLDTHQPPDGFQSVLAAGPMLDPAGSPQQCLEALEQTESAGASIINCAIRSESATHYIDQLHALAELRGLTP